jgi:hypothetical protein
VRPGPDLIEPGGFGRDREGVVRLGVTAHYPSGRVDVSTVRPGQAVAVIGSRRQRIEALIGHALGDLRDVPLPLTITVEADNRTIDVDGAPVGFAGERVAGIDCWTGAATLDDALVLIDAIGCRVDALVRCAPPG